MVRAQKTFADLKDINKSPGMLHFKHSSKKKMKNLRVTIPALKKDSLQVYFQQKIFTLKVEDENISVYKDFSSAHVRE